jgi:hypothetical protein
LNNIKVKVSGHTLVLEIDCSPSKIGSAQPSKTGSTLLLASSRGARDVPGIESVQFSLNVMVRR